MTVSSHPDLFWCHLNIMGAKNLFLLFISCIFHIKTKSNCKYLRNKSIFKRHKYVSPKALKIELFVQLPQTRKVCPELKESSKFSGCGTLWGRWVKNIRILIFLLYWKIFVKVFKSEPSEICGRQSLKSLKWYGLHTIKFCKGCLLQFLLGLFLNNFSHLT